MARIIAALIRHGDYHQLENTPSAWQPFPLNEAGKSHAQLAAQTLRDTLIENGFVLHPVCDSSQLLRAWQTAEIICHLLKDKQFLDNNGTPVKQIVNVAIASFDALAERSVGSAANLTIKQIEDIIHIDPRFADLPKNWKSNSHFCLPLQGAESLMDSGQRVAEHITKQMTELQQSAEQSTLKLFVGHGAAFRHAAHHLGLMSFEQIAQLSMYHGQPVFIELLEDGTWLHTSGEWKVRGQQSQYTD